jgi:hypothetical protein
MGSSSRAARGKQPDLPLGCHEIAYTSAIHVPEQNASVIGGLVLSSNCDLLPNDHSPTNSGIKADANCDANAHDAGRTETVSK